MCMKQHLLSRDIAFSLSILLAAYLQNANPELEVTENKGSTTAIFNGDDLGNALIANKQLDNFNRFGKD